jgi:hypothetical protein
MDLHTLKKLVKTKTFRYLIIGLALYLIIVATFIIFIEPDENKKPEGFNTLARDFVWIIGWRYYLDWPMMIGYFFSNLLLCAILRKLSTKIEPGKLSTYGVPIIIMVMNGFYMLVIDIAVTFFADVNFNGTWVSQQILFLGLNAQKLYHGFFFWFGPNIVFLALVSNSFLRTLRYRDALKTICTCMAIQFFTLGVLDAIVCHYLWNDWQIFGTWAMVGYDPMWAVGWITHYFILGGIWLFGILVIDRGIEELNRGIR